MFLNDIEDNSRRTDPQRAVLKMIRILLKWLAGQLVPVPVKIEKKHVRKSNKN